MTIFFFHRQSWSTVRQEMKSIWQIPLNTNQMSFGLSCLNQVHCLLETTPCSSTLKESLLAMELLVFTNLYMSIQKQEKSMPWQHQNFSRHMPGERFLVLMNHLSRYMFSSFGWCQVISYPLFQLCLYY